MHTDYSTNNRRSARDERTNTNGPFEDRFLTHKLASKCALSRASDRTNPSKRSYLTNIRQLGNSFGNFAGTIQNIYTAGIAQTHEHDGRMDGWINYNQRKESEPERILCDSLREATPHTIKQRLTTRERSG
ncbi:hypothetical protein ZHAS_00000088 [Anopheles sinensis]|uniref:Uncharacterized protein n=1 Tax=Anopheles sinensis TaxID=74873 RepID=A0A084V9V6_ANOSI|nr:hypothetical protein ZHAS_00000088 [Anopheles sinensis]